MAFACECLLATLGSLNLLTSIIFSMRATEPSRPFLLSEGSLDLLNECASLIRKLTAGI